MKLVSAILLAAALCGWSPDAFAVELAEAEAALSRGDVEGALILARQRAREAPGDVAAHELRIDLLLATGQSKAATSLYRQRAEGLPDNADAWYLLGRAMPDPAASEQAFNQALLLQPGHPRALTGLAAIKRSRAELDDALRAYELALKTDPTLSEAWAGIRAVHMMRGDGAALKQASLRAVEADPGDPQHWLAAAASAPAQADALLDRALKVHPKQPDVLVARARAAFERSDWDTAAQAYDKALKVGTGDVAAVHVEAALVQEIRSGALSLEGARELLQIRGLDDRQAGLQRLDGLVAAHPHSGWVLLVRGNLRAAGGSTSGAEKDLRAAITRMPSTPEAWSALGSFLLGQRRASEARPLLAQAARARPDDPGLAVAAAIAAAESGDLATAEGELQLAMGRFATSPGPPLGLARLYLSSGRPDAALAVLADALQRRPDLNLAGALVSSAQEAGQPQVAIDLLRRLSEQTGDLRLKSVADGLEAAATK